MVGSTITADYSINPKGNLSKLLKPIKLTASGRRARGYLNRWDVPMPAPVRA